MIHVITYKDRSIKVNLLDTSDAHQECKQLVASGQWSYVDYARVCEMINRAKLYSGVMESITIYVRMQAFRFGARECVEQIFCFDADETLEQCHSLAESTFREWFPTCLGWSLGRPLVVPHEEYLRWADRVYTLQDWCDGKSNMKETW